MIEILFTLEEAFKITVTAEQSEIRERVKTLGDLAAYVDELVAARAAGP
jgi:acyl carrier protein